MSLECDDFVFGKVNWPLPLRRGGWVGFRLTAKLPLSETRPNCRRSLTILLNSTTQYYTLPTCNLHLPESFFLWDLFFRCIWQFPLIVCLLSPLVLISFVNICAVLRDLIPFVQFKKREELPWRSVTFSKVPGKSCSFSRFLNCTNGTKTRNAPHLCLGTVN